MYEYNPFLKTDKHGQNKGIQRVPVGQATYTIFKQGNNIIAEPSPETGLRKFAGTDASTVIQNACDAGIHIIVKDDVSLSSTVSLNTQYASLVFQGNISGKGVILNNHYQTLKIVIMAGDNIGNGIYIKGNGCKVEGETIQNYANGILHEGQNYGEITVTNINTCTYGILFSDISFSRVNVDLITICTDGLRFAGHASENDIRFRGISSCTYCIHFVNVAGIMEGNRFYGTCFQTIDGSALYMENGADCIQQLYQGALDADALNANAWSIDDNTNYVGLGQPANTGKHLILSNFIRDNKIKNQSLGTLILDTQAPLLIWKGLFKLYKAGANIPAFELFDDANNKIAQFANAAGDDYIVSYGTGNINFSVGGGATTVLQANSNGYPVFPNIIRGNFGAGWVGIPFAANPIDGMLVPVYNTFYPGTCRMYIYDSAFAVWTFV